MPLRTVPFGTDEGCRVDAVDFVAVAVESARGKLGSAVLRTRDVITFPTLWL